MHSDLLWVTANSAVRNKSESTMARLAIAPSWSWVSVPPGAGVLFPRRYGRPAFEFDHQSLDETSREQYSAVCSAGLTLQSRQRPLLRGETQINWPEREPKDESGHLVFPDVRDVICSLQPETGRIPVSHSAAHPIVIDSPTCNSAL